MALAFWLVLRRRPAPAALAGAVVVLAAMTVVTAALLGSQYARHPNAVWIKTTYAPVREHWALLGETPSTREQAPPLPLPPRTVLSGRTSHTQAFYWTLAGIDEVEAFYRALADGGDLHVRTGESPSVMRALRAPDPRALRIGVDVLRE